MKKGLLLLFTVFALLACTDDSGVNPKHESEPVTVGWRSAGFTPVISKQRGGGLQKVTHSGNWLVLMDAWTSPVENQSDTWTTLTYTPRLFISKIGTDVWDTLVPPTSAYIRNSSLYADSSGIYVGTNKTGNVLVYNPEKKEWKELNVVKKDVSAWHYVIGIQKFKGNLIVSIGSYPDTLNTKIVTASILLQNDTGWLSLPTPPIRYDMYKDDTVPLQFTSSAEMGGSLYVGTGDGVWKLDGTSLSWTELPKFPKMMWNSKYRDVYQVEDLVAYKGWDDDFDTDNGFSGKVQYGLSLRDSKIADTSQSNGFESDNCADGATVDPRTKATFSNITFVGPKVLDDKFQNTTDYITAGAYNPNNGSALGKFQAAMQIRRSSNLNCINSVALGWPIGLIIDGEKGETVQNSKDKKFKLQNIYFAGMDAIGSDANKIYGDYLYDAAAKKDIDKNQKSYSNTFFFSEPSNKYFDSWTSLVGADGYTPIAGSPLLGAASFAGWTGFDAVTYIGAFDGSNNWMSGWTNFDPQNAKY